MVPSVPWPWRDAHILLRTYLGEAPYCCHWEKEAAELWGEGRLQRGRFRERIIEKLQKPLETLFLNTRGDTG